MKKTYIEECLERANAAKNTSFIDPLKCEEIEKCGVRIGHNIAYIEGNAKVCDFLLSAIVDVPELCTRLQTAIKLIYEYSGSECLKGYQSIEIEKLEASLEGSER